MLVSSPSRMSSEKQAVSMTPAERGAISAALAGDDEAFEKLIRIYSRRVYVVAYAMVQDVAEAEDIVQETFLKAHRMGRGMRDPDKFPAWLLTVARNAARDRLRRRRPQASGETLEDLADDHVARPAAAMEQQEFRSHLRRALAGLPEDYRTALTLRYLEELDYRAIEVAMGLSNGALRGILGRALATLRRVPALERYRP